jgi:thiol-disulfide isomerase/thioredoxin
VLRPIFSALFLSSFLSSAALAAESLNIERELSRPGVKLLAVDVYATWCEPCMKAMPKWKALREQYRDQGLRVIMVHTQDPGKPCGEGVSDFADDVICDEKGYMANWLRVRESLPAAFLWSWQGNMLVKTGHIEKVETEVQDYLSAVPRVSIEAQGPDGQASRDLRDWVTGELQRASKFTLVVTDEERAIAARLREESYQANFDDKTKCKLGEEISANASLQVRVGGEGPNRQLILSLFSAEQGCSLGMASVEYRENDVLGSVQAGVDMLMGQLRNPSIEMPGGVQTSMKKAGFGAELSAISIPEVERLQLAEVQFDIEGADLEFLEAWARFDSTIELAAKLDRSETLAPDKKARAWDGALKIELPEIPKSFRDLYAARVSEARQRRDAWLAVIKAKSEAEEAWRADTEKYERDLDRLNRFKALPDKIVSPEQKQAYEEEFEAAYAPYLAERERRQPETNGSDVVKSPSSETASASVDNKSANAEDSQSNWDWRNISASAYFLDEPGATGVSVSLPRLCHKERPFCLNLFEMSYAKLGDLLDPTEHDTTHDLFEFKTGITTTFALSFLEFGVGGVLGVRVVNGARPRKITACGGGSGYLGCEFYGQYVKAFIAGQAGVGIRFSEYFKVSVVAEGSDSRIYLWKNQDGTPSTESGSVTFYLPMIEARFW